MGADSESRWASLERDLAHTLTIVRRLETGFVGATAAGDQVRVEHTRGLVGEWIVLRTSICWREEMDPDLALERNNRLAFATIVLGDGAYWLRVAMPFDSTELQEPNRVVTLLIEAAHSLSPRQGNATQTDALDYFAT